MASLASVVAATFVWAAIAVPARATTVAYVKDHNIWIASPDGSIKRQLTTSGNATDRWQAPSVDDQGRMVAVTLKRHFFMGPNGETQILANNLAPMSCSAIGGPVGPVGSTVNPSGSLIAFSYGCSGALRTSMAFTDMFIAPGNEANFDGFGNPSWWRDRLVVDDSQDVFVQTTPSSVTFTRILQANMGFRFFQPWIARDGTFALIVVEENATLRRSLLLIGLNGADTPAPTGAGCVVATAANPGSPSISADGAFIAWDDAGGAKVAAKPTVTAANDCVETGTTTVLDAAGTSPQPGGGTLVNPTPPPPPAPQPTPPSPPPPAPAKDVTAPGTTGLVFSAQGARRFLALQLSEAATATVVIERRLASGRFKKVKTVVVRLTTGLGRIALGRLAPGRYRLKIALVDAAGNKRSIARAQVVRGK